MSRKRASRIPLLASPTVLLLVGISVDNDRWTCLRAFVVTALSRPLPGATHCLHGAPVPHLYGADGADNREAERAEQEAEHDQ